MMSVGECLNMANDDLAAAHRVVSELNKKLDARIAGLPTMLRTLDDVEEGMQILQAHLSAAARYANEVLLQQMGPSNSERRAARGIIEEVAAVEAVLRAEQPVSLLAAA